MKKSERVKSNILFNEIINKGTKVSNSMFSIFFISKNDNNPLFGVAAPKKLGNAVIRNKVKRQTRALVDNNKLLFKNNRNYIIIVKEKFLTSDYPTKLENFKNLIGEANEK
jgi:ribonuclease P protein component